MTRMKWNMIHVPALLLAGLLAIPAVAFPANPTEQKPSAMNSKYAMGEEPGNIQEENITVSCFKGNLDAGNYIGSLTVTSPQTAGRSCNSTYYDCQGECLGCYTDSNGAQVCYDNDGRKFLK